MGLLIVIYKVEFDMKRRKDLTFQERLYLPEIARGLFVTTYRFCRNLSLHLLHTVGIAKDQRAAITVQYPDEHKRYPDNYRGSHRLTLKGDGAVRCTACFLCATACPANCIYIEAGEHPAYAVARHLRARVERPRDPALTR